MYRIRTIFQSKPSHVKFITLLAICFIVAFSLSTVAQENPVSESSIRTETGVVLPSMEEIEAQIKQNKDAKEQQAGEDQKKNFDNLIDIYEKAKSKYIEVQKYEASIAEFQNARKQAPERLLAVRAELEQIPVEAKIEENYSEWTLVQIEQHVAQKEAELTNAKNNVAERESEAKQRSTRRTEVPQATAQAKEKLENIKKELGVKSAAEVPQEIVKAKRILLLLTEKSLQKEIESYTEEILSYDARGDLLGARRDLAVRRVSQYEKLLKQWQELLNKRRKTEAEQAAEKARQAKRDAAQSHPLIRKLAEENARLAELRTGPKGLVATNAAKAADLKIIDNQLTELDKEFNSVKDKVEAAGLTDVIGVILLGKRGSLPDVHKHQLNIRNRRAETAKVRYESIKYDEQNNELADIEKNVGIILGELEPTLDQEQR